MREYIVSLVKDVDYDSFWNEIENESPLDGFLPSRRVEIINERPGSLRSCHYALSDEEAEKLRQDPRVYCVEIPPEQREDIKIGIRTSQSSNFNKPTLSESSHPSSGTYTNWGLIRNSNQTNVYGTGTTTSSSYNYLADGTGVDVVIQDTGIQVDHPEFQNTSGTSRVQQINWYTESGLSGSQSPNHYRDYNGHGTHVAGIATGKTYGWAKNANIYALKVSGLEGSGDSGTGISVTDCFDVIKLWHRNKPIDPTLGRKRPTIVNMSWGYSASYGNITGGSYRGSSWFGSSADINKGMNDSFSCPVRVGSVDVDVEELISEGVIVCIAAGNSSHKIDVAGGVDYNNYWTSSLYGNIYYHRGMSPSSPNAIIVGALNVTPHDATTDRKSWFSNGGPGVDVFTAGSQILSATSTTNEFTGGTYSSSAYHLNGSYRQLNLSGTSQASPQATGLLSCYLQNNLTSTPAQAKSWLKNNATTTLYSTGLDNDYSNQYSQFGGSSNVAYSFTAAGNEAKLGIQMFLGTGGKSSASFKRLPPRVADSFYNFGFEDGTIGWTVLDRQVHFKGNQAGQPTSIIANFPMPLDPYTIGDGTSGTTSLVPNAYFTHSFETSDMPPLGMGETQCIRMTLSPFSAVNSYSTVYGPVLYSDVSVNLKEGDIIKFWFKGLNGTDKYNVYSYIVEQSSGNCIKIMSEVAQTATPNEWKEVTYTVQSGEAGDYCFVFVNGTWDWTGGQAIGADMLVDTIRVLKA